MNISLIVNPNAGKKRGLDAAGLASSLLHETGIGVETFISQKPGGTLEIAKDIDLDETDGVLAVGGDGTLFEIINGLLSQRGSLDIPIGQIPVGTGNSFIKDLGIATVEESVQHVIRGSSREIDLGLFTSGDESWYFVNLLGAGFVSDVAYKAKQFKAFGALGYVAGVMEALKNLRAVPSKITIDGTTFSRNMQFIEICNSRYTGGAMMMAPGAAIDDGLLDIVLLNRITRRRLLYLFPSLFKGTHVDAEEVEVIQGKRITVETEIPLPLTPDGETFGTTPISVEVVPKKIRMFC